MFSSFCGVVLAGSVGCWVTLRKWRGNLQLSQVVFYWLNCTTFPQCANLPSFSGRQVHKVNLCIWLIQWNEMITDCIILRGLGGRSEVYW